MHSALFWWGTCQGGLRRCSPVGFWGWGGGRGRTAKQVLPEPEGGGGGCWWLWVRITNGKAETAFCGEEGQEFGCVVCLPPLSWPGHPHPFPHFDRTQ